ncbi:uncharacterized protein C1orf232 [Amia ocellicauda]|uniref:uncharacterized protein C1orf232 n=1 Tax=Amia ocellicauda TaxID=2972642 RepID=UPI003463E858
MNPAIWKTYKSKVMKTINPEFEEDTVEQNNEPETDITPTQEEEGPSAVSTLARKMQGAGTKGWKSMSALFNKDDEHKLLAPESQPVADHPLAVKPEEPRPNKRATGFWDNFAVKWQQAAAMKEAEGEVAGEAVPEEGREAQEEAAGRRQQEEEEEGAGSESNNSSKYTTLGGAEDTGFKWNFVTSKLAELKSKSLAKTN